MESIKAAPELERRAFEFEKERPGGHDGFVRN